MCRLANRTFHRVTSLDLPNPLIFRPLNDHRIRVNPVKPTTRRTLSTPDG